MRHSYNLFLDDTRKSTDQFVQDQWPEQFKQLQWRHVKSYSQFVEVVTDGFLRDRFPLRVAFDHDLGKYDGGKTGLDCARWMMDFCLSNDLPFPEITCHSTNPPGKEAILRVPRDFGKAKYEGYKPIKDVMVFDSLESQAEMYAKNCHRSTNHHYTKEHPYEFHLAMVVGMAKKWLPTVKSIRIEAYDLVFAICWTHDVIEDTRQTYNDVKAATHYSVAEGAFYLTELRGKNRRERHGPEYWSGIKQDVIYIFCKCMDRMANLSFAIESDNLKMMEMQAKEMPHFISNLKCNEAIGMEDVFYELQQLAARATEKAKSLSAATADE